MSTNSKNTIRNAYMSNFTTKKKHRYIVTEKGSQLDTDIQNNLNKINDSINTAIQELSIRIHDRQIPYMIIEKLPVSFDDDTDETEKRDKTKRVRGLLRDIATEKELLNLLDKKFIRTDVKISHAIEFFANTTYSALTFSNLNFDAKMYLNTKGFITAFTDIFMDSAMFNSYSFLKGMGYEEKHLFGIRKLEFYRKRKLPCFYRFDSEDEDKLFYYSLAFSCRNSKEEFDFETYVDLWEDFISEYYPNETHKEKSVSEQLKQYIDPEQFPKGLAQQISRKGEGAYLVLRINRDRTTSLQKRICNYFGLEEFQIGKVKVVDISEYYNIQDMLRNLDVAAYKVVKRKNK